MLELNFTDINIEDSVACKNDMIIIATQETFENETIIGSYCGKQKNLIITSNRPTIFVKFKSNESGTSKGFNVTYKAVKNGVYI